MDLFLGCLKQGHNSPGDSDLFLKVADSETFEITLLQALHIPHALVSLMMRFSCLA